MSVSVGIHQIPTEYCKTTRQHFCTSFIRKCEQNSDFDKEQCSDKTYFHVDGKIDSQKFGFWSHGKPDVVAETPLHSAKFTCVMITEQ